jgi:hypothetical protein
MKQLCYALAAISFAAVVFTSTNSIAQTSTALDQLQFGTALDFFNCNTEFDIAEAITDTPGYGIKSPKSIKAYQNAHDCADKAKQNAEARFASVKRQIASNEAAMVALKELYIYWLTEISLGTPPKNYDAVMHKFKSLLERVRVEASW